MYSHSRYAKYVKYLLVLEVTDFTDRTVFDARRLSRQYCGECNKYMRLNEFKSKLDSLEHYRIEAASSQQTQGGKTSTALITNLYVQCCYFITVVLICFIF